MQIIQNHSLLPYNSFRIDVTAKNFVEITQEEELNELFQQQGLTKPLLVMGGGSNMLFTRNFEGTIIRIAIKGISFEINESEVLVRAGAGEVWDDLVRLCISSGYAGIENLSLIPGTVGASPVQNIGAYGVELSDVFHDLRAFDLETRAFVTFTAPECKFAYRDSVFKGSLEGRYIISSVCLRLSTEARLDVTYGSLLKELEAEQISEPSIADVGRIVSKTRTLKLPDPGTIGNAGSFFKNPLVSEETFNRLIVQFPSLIYYPAGNGHVKLAAGWLIEQCGWKGKTKGHAGTWKHQALVLVNNGSAKGSEILELAEEIMRDVQEKFGIRIEPEVNII